MTLVERRIPVNTMAPMQPENNDMSPFIRARTLVQQYNSLALEITKLRRKNSSASTLSVDSGYSPTEAELQMVRKQLERTRRESLEMIQSHKQLLAKISKQKTNPLYRIFSARRERKMADMKLRLSVELSEAAKVDSEIEVLERQSLRLTEICHSEAGSPVADNNYDESMKQKNMKKTNVLNDIFKVVPTPESLRNLKSLESLQVSEVQALDCIKSQAEELMCQYRQAIHLLRMATAKVFSPDYQSSMSSFLNGPYPLALEASRIVNVASMLIQPESKRKYPQFASPLRDISLPNFPSSVSELARPGSHIRNRMSPEDLRDKLVRSEEVVVKMQELVAENVEILSAWIEELDEDRSDAIARRIQLSRQVEKCTDHFISELSKLANMDR